MNIKTGMLAIGLALVYPIITPMLIAHWPWSLPVWYKLFSLIVVPLAFRLLVGELRKSDVILMNAPTLFLFYLIVQTILVAFSAQASVRIVLTNLLLVASLYGFFVLGYRLFPKGLEPYLSTRVLTAILAIIALGMVIDFLGFGAFFQGSYAGELNPRFGFVQVHGFLPWPNALANILLLLGLCFEIKNSKLSWASYALLLPTFVRANVIAAALIIAVTKRKFQRAVVIAVIIGVGGYAFINQQSFLADVIQSSAPELDIHDSGDDTVYRIAYVNGALAVLQDYPVLGIGINRLTSRGIWDLDSFHFNTAYGLPTELFDQDISTSDTGFTFFAEIGWTGIALFIWMILAYLRKCYLLRRPAYAAILLGQLVLIYSSPAGFVSLTSSLLFWLAAGSIYSQYEVRRGAARYSRMANIA